MVAKNDVTGDALRSKAPTKEYADGWDRIFGKKQPEMWQHFCKHNGMMSVGKGESCSWCGEREDGTID